jgi:hypothetical protein
MNIEITKDDKKVRPTKVKPITEFNMVDIDFSSINGLRINKQLLDFLFKNLKIELSQNG